jgi:hypothetical protein
MALALATCTTIMLSDAEFLENELELKFAGFWRLGA